MNTKVDDTASSEIPVIGYDEGTPDVPEVIDDAVVVADAAKEPSIGSEDAVEPAADPAVNPVTPAAKPAAVKDETEKSFDDAIEKSLSNEESVQVDKTKAENVKVDSEVSNQLKKIGESSFEEAQEYVKNISSRPSKLEKLVGKISYQDDDGSTKILETVDEIKNFYEISEKKEVAVVEKGESEIKVAEALQKQLGSDVSIDDIVQDIRTRKYGKMIDNFAKEVGVDPDIVRNDKNLWKDIESYSEFSNNGQPLKPSEKLSLALRKSKTIRKSIDEFKGSAANAKKAVDAAIPDSGGGGSAESLPEMTEEESRLAGEI